MATKIDKEACREAYNLVRDDATEVNWVTFKYNGSTIVPGDQGVDYETFKRKCTDDVRLFGFVRFTTGDAMSKRVKFALITWIGEDVSGLQRAKTGTDKTLVKEVVQNSLSLNTADFYFPFHLIKRSSLGFCFFCFPSSPIFF
uniref:Coactosin-like protein n=1 Tax=Gallus gallus TaxID=9031 RepID=A0A8V0XP83_CHICK